MDLEVGISMIDCKRWIGITVLTLVLERLQEWFQNRWEFLNWLSLILEEVMESRLTSRVSFLCMALEEAGSSMLRSRRSERF